MGDLVPDDDPTLRSLLASCQAADEPHGPLMGLCDWLTRRGDPRGEVFRLQDEYWRLSVQGSSWGPSGYDLEARRKADEVQGRVKAAWPPVMRAWLPDWAGGEWDLYPDYPFLHLNINYPPPGDPSVRAALRAGWISSLRISDGPEVDDFPVAWFDGVGPIRYVLLDDNPAVRNADLVALQRVPCLDSLWLEGTRVSDRGLVHLHPIKTLRFVCLTRTKVTGAGAAGLASAVPGCHVEGIEAA